MDFFSSHGSTGESVPKATRDAYANSNPVMRCRDSQGGKETRWAYGWTIWGSPSTTSPNWRRTCFFIGDISGWNVITDRLARTTRVSTLYVHTAARSSRLHRHNHIQSRR